MLSSEQVWRVCVTMFLVAIFAHSVDAQLLVPGNNIKNAVDSAEQHGTVTLSAGTYVHTASSGACGIVVGTAKNVTIIGQGTVIIDCNGISSHLEAINGSTVTIQNVQLKSGGAAVGGASIKASGSSTKVTITGSKISECTATDKGGALHVSDGAVVELVSTSLTTNKAPVGGCGFVTGTGSKITMSASTMSSCTATGTGGGVHVEDGGMLSLSAGSEVKTCRASAGGGVMVNGAGSSLAIDASSFSYNTASTGNGGGISGVAGASVTVTGASSMSFNKATIGTGGALFLDASTATFTGATTFEYNGANMAGSAVHTMSGSTLTLTGAAVLTGNVVDSLNTTTCTNSPVSGSAFDGAVVQNEGSCSWTCSGANYISVAAGDDLMTSGVCTSCTMDACNTTGEYRGACTRSADGACKACTNKPLYSAYTGAGDTYNVNNCSWECGIGYTKEGLVCVPCPDGQVKTTAGNQACSSNCPAGQYRNGSTCLPCETSRCPVGHYRGTCGGTMAGECTACTGAPGSSVFVTSGDPYDANNCVWGCAADGILGKSWWNNTAVSTTASVETTTPSPAATSSSNSSNSSNSSDSSRRLLQDTTASENTTAPPSGSADSGAAAFSTANCKTGEFLGQCWCEPCSKVDGAAPFTTVGSVVDNKGQDDCSFECKPGFFKNAHGKCSSCQAVVCPAGQYRGPCKGANDTLGDCLPCTNAPPKASYITPSSNDTASVCAWECAGGTKPDVNGSCSACPVRECSIGYYRMPCDAAGNAKCAPCTSKTALGVYTSSGIPFNKDACNSTCPGENSAEDQKMLRVPDLMDDVTCCPRTSIVFTASLSTMVSYGLAIESFTRVVDKITMQITPMRCVSSIVPGGIPKASGRRAEGAEAAKTNDMIIESTVRVLKEDIVKVVRALTPEAIMLEFDRLGFLNVRVADMKIVSSSNVTITSEAVQAARDPAGAIAGGVIGGVAFVCICVGLYHRYGERGFSMPSLPFLEKKSPGRYTPATGGAKKKDEDVEMSARPDAVAATTSPTKKRTDIEAN